MAGSGTAHLRERDDVLVRVEHMVVEFPIGRGQKVHAVSDVSFDLVEGETLGIVGESGCGKSTTAKATIQLPRPTDGSVWFKGQDITKFSAEQLRRVRPEFQMIFQDPISSLNPRRTVREIIAEGLKVWGDNETWQLDRIEELMEAVGIDPRYGDRKPHQFSGGQCQRISIARALVLDPKVIICDEPVSALDVSVQAAILNLLANLQRDDRTSYLFISHDIGVVRYLADRIAVMYVGRIMELGSTDAIFEGPNHPYTEALLSAVPSVDGEAENRIPLTGEIPSPADPPSGCVFHTRCHRFVEGLCDVTEPELQELSPGHSIKCHLTAEQLSVPVTLSSAPN